MARSRNIKPGFFTNDDLAQCQYGARLLFAGLWTIADREGRLEDRPARIKAVLFPFDKCDVEKWLDQLTERKFIVRYAIAGTRFIQISNFHKHQTPHIKEPQSTIPAPDSSCSGTSNVFLSIETGISNQESGISNQSTGAKKFVPPTVDQVSEYCRERSNGLDAEAFVAFYASKGWKIGKNAMKDWRSAIVTWEKNQGKFGGDKPRAQVVEGLDL